MATTPNALPAKTLLLDIDSPLEPASFMRGLILAGLAEHAEYLSTTGSGEIKRYTRLTEKGLTYGINKSNPMHEIKTEPRFLSDSFCEVHMLAAKAILEFSEKISLTEE